jgi:hypothetical protein
VIVEAGSNYRRICFWFIVVVCERERKVESKNKDLGTYSCKLDRHTIVISLSLKGLEGKYVGRNLLRLKITAKILD